MLQYSYMKWAQKYKGFTIVELLIVVVVIAILAAITIVAYNGIQNRAKVVAVQAEVSQASTKIDIYAATNDGQYPNALGDAGVTNTDSLQYTGGGAAYCLTGTKYNMSYYTNNTTNSTSVGACPGHALNGVPAVTISNLNINSSFEYSDDPLMGYSANNASSSLSVTPDRAKNGSSSLLVTAVSETNGYNGLLRYYRVTAGKTYTFSAWVYLPAAYSTAGVAATTNGAGTPVKQGNFVTATGSWTRTSVTFSPTTTGNASLYVITSSSSKPTVGATFYVDSVMFTEGDTLYNYADGGSPGWSWAGIPHASASSGPAL